MRIQKDGDQKHRLTGIIFHGLVQIIKRAQHPEEIRNNISKRGWKMV